MFICAVIEAMLGLRGILWCTWPPAEGKLYVRSFLGPFLLVTVWKLDWLPKPLFGAILVV